MTTKQMDELGQALINIAALTPKGMVVFVPSYDFLDQIQWRWEKTGARQRLTAKKEVRHGVQAELLFGFLACTDAIAPTGILGAKVERRRRCRPPSIRRRKRWR